MSVLYFRQAAPEGFTAKLADKKEGFARPIRELLQNSLDASQEAGNSRCEVSLYIERIPMGDIPHIDDYKRILGEAIEYHKKEGSYNDNAQQIVESVMWALSREVVDVLMLVDNGVGMSRKILHGLIDGKSIKAKKSSGGSFGVGHFSSYFLSSLRYVLYASKYKEDGSDAIKTLYSGSPILAGYRDEHGTERGGIGRILDKEPDDERNADGWHFPSEFPPFIEQKMDKLSSTGSMVAIIGLNESWNKAEVEYATVSNFFYAIHKNQLQVDMKQHNISSSIVRGDVDKVLKKNKDGKIAGGSRVLAEQHVYQSWLTVKDETCKQFIDLPNGDKVCVHIRNGIETDSVIALVRNGMLVARHNTMLSTDWDSLRRSESFKPFSIVINVDERECAELYRLVKGAEGPYHDRLENKRLSNKDGKTLRKLLKELKEKVIGDNFLEKVDRDGFSPQGDMFEDIEHGHVGERIQGQMQGREQSQAAPDKRKQRPPKPRPDKAGRPAPKIARRTLDSKIAVRIIKDDGEMMAIKLMVKPITVDENDDAYLLMSLANDDDKGKSGSALDIVGASMDGQSQLVPEDTGEVKLGKLSEGRSYTVEAQIKKPANVKNTRVAVVAFLGLKRDRRREHVG